MTTRAHRMKFWHLLLCILAVGALLVGAQPASALQANVCMQTNYTNHGKTQTLNCTANDVRVARATNIDIISGGECHLDQNGQKVCTCNLGGNVTFSADYEVVLTAQTRYDVGIYFATDGDPNNDGALTGACVLTALDGNSSNPIQLDAAPDVCGDIDAAHNPQILHLTLANVACQPGADGKLKLPNCTSWRQPGSNEVCTQATDAFPGSPSKCNCSPGFTVDIFVETATIEVTKTALTPTVPETGGSVTYSVAVKNLAQQASITLDSLTDSLYGDITTTGHDGITATTCATGGTIAAQATYNCQFTVTVGPGDTGQTITDIVTACATDSFGHTNLCDDDDAVVTYTDVAAAPSLSKTATAASNVTFSVDVNYDVVVTNNSSIDTLTVNSLTDDKFGSITSVHDNVISTTCAAGGTIAPSGSYSCSFVGRITSSPHTDIVTGNLTDDDGVISTPSDSATVNVQVNVTFP
jgi:hypothetical protein